MQVRLIAQARYSITPGEKHHNGRRRGSKPLAPLFIDIKEAIILTALHRILMKSCFLNLRISKNASTSFLCRFLLWKEYKFASIFIQCCNECVDLCIKPRLGGNKYHLNIFYEFFHSKRQPNFFISFCINSRFKHNYVCWGNTFTRNF